MRLTLLVAALLFVTLSAYAPHLSAAPSAPEAKADSTEWENLQVLPDSLSRDELIGMMRGYADGLGVKCGYCHVREDGEFAFGSDAKPEKEVARGMIRMVRQINTEILPAIDRSTDEAAEPQVDVTCWTCHRGDAKPRALPSPSEPQR
ncbi:c-type cytochrome [Rubricoccus marinus]|uniref:Photosynthetic reaction center cytochrome c subunit n=1 Tax=Rubricoccus marinus TaxID=716817 RepID=A0A259TYU5_9BACT|nr:c-type cytochrome [Rubricoccus marinus]OZC02860.1 hypothetical protein BSZ36_07665 [Rubricoccus marinus]